MHCILYSNILFFIHDNNILSCNINNMVQYWILGYDNDVLKRVLPLHRGLYIRRRKASYLIDF